MRRRCPFRPSDAGFVGGLKAPSEHTGCRCTCIRRGTSVDRLLGTQYGRQPAHALPCAQGGICGTSTFAAPGPAPEPRTGDARAPGAPPRTPRSARGRLGLPYTPGEGATALVSSLRGRRTGSHPWRRNGKPPGVNDLASRAYRRAIAALCGYSEPLKLSAWRGRDLRPPPRLLHLDGRPIAALVHAHPTGPVGPVAAARGPCPMRAPDVAPRTA